MPSAYVALANITLSGAATTVTFSSISQSYRDLILVIRTQSGNASSHQPGLRTNNITNSYSYQGIYGNGSSAAAASGTGQGQMNLTGNQSALRADGPLNIIAQLNDYSATNKFKTCISRADGVTSSSLLTVSSNENTGAVSTLTVMNATFASGSTFALYGVSA
jgi:hypothetical protein